MNPQQLAQLQAQVAELLAWKAARERQQLSYPVDDTSRLALRAVTDSGFGSSALTQNVTISSTPQSITVPATPAGSILLFTPSGTVEVPYLSTS